MANRKNETVLIVDDDPHILTVYGLALEEAGYQVISASTGSEGLSSARKYLPDLILTDINMPGMDGKTLLKTLREDPDLGTAQIVLMTGQTGKMNARKGMEIGADDFLEKPFTYQDLIQCVEARLKRAKVHWRVEDKVIRDLQSDLVSALPHEVFTPLAGILGLVEVMRNSLAELSHEEMDDLLELIETSGWRLQRTMRNYTMILDLQLSESDSREETSLLYADMIQEVVTDQIKKVGKRHDRLDDIEYDIEEASILGGRTSLAIITEELIDNACTFSAEGTTINVYFDAKGVLTVKDEGKGMSESQIRGIRAFLQYDRKVMEQQGLGLGLVLIQKLSNRCEAELSLNSELGVGTTARVAFRSGT